MMAVLLIVGLVIGAGVGYFMAPTKTETETVTVEVEPLKGKTVQIGNIISNDPALEWEVPYNDDILVPDMNEMADLLGYDVTFDILTDSAQSQAAIHLEKVQSFKAMDINVVIGGRWSSQASGALSYVTENNILLWSPSSTAPTLRIADDNLFRMCPDDTVQAPAIAEMLWSWGIEAIIVIQRADAWADGIYNILKPEFEARGGVVEEQIRYMTEAREFSSYLASAETIAEDLVAEYGAEHVGIELICFGEDGGPLLTQVEDYPTLWSLMWFGSDGSALTQLIQDNAPSQADHLKVPSTMAAPGVSEVFTNLYNRYVASTGVSMGYYSACTYDIMTTLFESITSAQSTDPVDLIPLQFEYTYHTWGASGWTQLNEAGDRKASNYNIWGFSYIGDEAVFALWGLYDGAAGTVVWHPEGETTDGRPLPGITPVGH
jgi:branched-chain amino acid transport system substrate-binding protein